MRPLLTRQPQSVRESFVRLLEEMLHPSSGSASRFAVEFCCLLVCRRARSIIAAYRLRQHCRRTSSRRFRWPDQPACEQPLLVAVNCILLPKTLSTKQVPHDRAVQDMSGRDARCCGKGSCAIGIEQDDCRDGNRSWFRPGCLQLDR
jgi:hypothetical protein